MQGGVVVRDCLVVVAKAQVDQAATVEEGGGAASSAQGGVAVGQGLIESLPHQRSGPTAGIENPRHQQPIARVRVNPPGVLNDRGGGLLDVLVETSDLQAGISFPGGGSICGFQIGGQHIGSRVSPGVQPSAGQERVNVIGLEFDRLVLVSERQIIL